MIPPYKGTFQPSIYGNNLEEYIKNTVIVSKSEDVKRFIRCYMWKLEAKNVQVDSEVQMVLQRILKMEDLLQKTQIISLISWRNSVLVLRPNQIWYDSEHADVLYALEHYRKLATTFFLYLHEEPINRFMSHTLATRQEKENIRYFNMVKRQWREDYESFKKDKINDYLDKYNQYMRLYESSKDEQHLSSARAILREMKEL